MVPSCAKSSVNKWAAVSEDEPKGERWKSLKTHKIENISSLRGKILDGSSQSPNYFIFIFVYLFLKRMKSI